MPRRLPFSRALLATVTVALALLLTGQTLADPADVSNADTRAFLKLLADAIPMLGNAWSGRLDGDLCNSDLTYITCYAATMRVSTRDALSTVFTGSLPELPDSINGDNVMVSEIFLTSGGSKLTGTLPETWWRLSNLVTLDLSWNPLTGTLPAIWSRMTKLEGLWISGLAITGTLPPEWGSGMSNMKDFLAVEMQLSGTLPPEWSQMTRMEIFIVYSNQLSGSLPPQYGTWTNLQSLALSNNSLSSAVGMAEWGDMTELEYVSLASNALTGDLPNLPNLPFLRRLDFSSNAMDGTLSASWGGLTFLTEVHLSGNRFCSCVPDSWHGSRALQTALDDMGDNGVALRAAGCETANVCPVRPPGDLTALSACPAVLAFLLVAAVAILTAYACATGRHTHTTPPFGVCPHTAPW